jgi:hypothetical protein
VLRKERQSQAHDPAVRQQYLAEFSLD